MASKHGLLFGALLCTLLASGCPTAETPADWVCYDSSGSVDSDVGASTAALVFYRRFLWPEGRRAISVCWEDETWEGRDYGRFRALVREAVTEQWEKTLATLEDGTAVPEDLRVRFVGWVKCSEGFSDGIRIHVSDEVPSTVLGFVVAAQPQGMILNFEFRRWEPTCLGPSGLADPFCVRSIAVHEFGHALGFSHEQDRTDTPAHCADEALRPGGDFYGGSWDLNSVLNYCSPAWNNDGQLSAQDARWSRIAYYPRYYPDLKCQPLATGGSASSTP